MAPIWRISDRTLTLERPLVMGIVNVTPDSFSDGGKFVDSKAAIAHSRQLIADGRRDARFRIRRNAARLARHRRLGERRRRHFGRHFES
jgi:hypothetical protein